MSDIEQFIFNKLEKLDEKLDEVREHNASIKASFQSHVNIDEKIHEEVLKLAESIDKHSKLLDDYNKQLEIHIKRTDLLEKQIVPVVIEHAEQKIVHKHRSLKFKKIAKIIGYLTAAAGCITAIVQALKILGMI